jgi:hypothetical protein
LLVDCGRIIRHPAIKNDSGAILSIGLAPAPVQNERRQGLGCLSKEHAKDNLARGVRAASGYNRNRGRFCGGTTRF